MALAAFMKKKLNDSGKGSAKDKFAKKPVDPDEEDDDEADEEPPAKNKFGKKPVDPDDDDDDDDEDDAPKSKKPPFPPKKKSGKGLAAFAKKKLDNTDDEP